MQKPQQGVSVSGTQIIMQELAGLHLADWPDAEGTTTVAAKALSRATRLGTRMASPPQITVSMARVTVTDLSVVSQGLASGFGERAVEACEPR